MSDRITLPSYDAISSALRDCHIALDAAEIHGLITGALTANHQPKAALAAIRNVIAESDEQDAHNEAAIKLLETLCHTTALQLADHSFVFHLLVPEDDAPLATRIEAIGMWCQGFISGLGEGGLSLENEHAAELNDIIHDLSAIAQIDSTEVTESEEEEVAYHELTEYVRVVVMTIYTDTIKTIH